MKNLIRNIKVKSLTKVIVIALIAILFSSCQQFKLSYIGGLKEHAEFESTMPTPDIEFKYSSSNDSNLVYLRQKYNIDSIAGNGSDIEQIINLMYWVHNLAPHAVNPTWPRSLNSLNLIDICINEKKSINCYMHSVILNEVYLSMGYYSRFIHLWYTHSGESHVVNSVFVPSLNKWVMMDSDFGAYCMDENKNILNIPEIRDRLVNKQEILFNDDLNVEIPKFIKALFGGNEKSYRYYLSKNIFMYSTPVNNVFNIKTNRTAKIIRLIPTNYVEKVNLHKRERPYEPYKYYYTDNESFFWQKPMSN